ncbi:ribonuclease Y [Patescibacteria group bacterium]|nr:ribonuclease Y [Patescibacteria group bacterium]MBU2159010.1 ribonuclease Y [Patescibacteria group bacterium]MBU2220946.1 ribonuclease Y [Patescibacteria group bacterium]
MSIKIVLSLLALSGLAGIALGYVLRLLIALGQRGSLELEVKQKMLEAKERANRLVEDAEHRAKKLEAERYEPLKEREQKVAAYAERLSKREEFLDERERGLSTEAEDVKNRENEAANLKREFDKLLAERRQELVRLSHITENEARTLLMKDLEESQQESVLMRLQKLEAHGKAQLEEKAKSILLSIIHRMSASVNNEVMTLSVQIPSEEIKGKVIGKEGRNIKAFERATGVDVIIDDAPDKITLSSFDPLRRHTAKLALERLISDGRIQPAKIEESVEKAREEITEMVRQKGEEAAYEVGVVGLNPRLIALLGRLHFRTSYGQNVLRHSIEMAHLAAMLATELGADVDVAKAGALLHDIGKAVDHEVEGTHVEIGRRILEKFGVEKPVIQAMQSHHEEYPYETPESIIVQVADAISAGRPGARRDTVERYLDRLGDLERIAASFPGVEKVYAISAGREIRIFVNPGKVSDLAMHRLARDISDRVQAELKYPGEIKVNVIRENRVVEFAR